MNAEPKQLITPVALTKTATKIYQAPANKSVIVTKLVVANTVDDLVAVTINVVPQGDSASTKNQVVPKRNLNNFESWSAYQVEGIVLNQGDSIYASTDDSGSGGVNVIAAGVEIV